MGLPCKKCILLVMCVNKSVIECDILSDAANNSSDENYDIWWGLVNKHLPQVIIIKNSKGEFAV